MSSGQSNRLKVVAALAVLNDGDEAEGLVSYMSAGDDDEFKVIAGSYLGQEDREAAMSKVIRQMISSEKFSSFAEVHPAWILEHLKNEKPRLIGIILRLLPSRHVRYILKNLPPMLGEQIPKLVESFSVHPGVLEVIRKEFEGKFLAMRMTRDIENFGFDNLYYLKDTEIDELLKDLGLNEMAVALSGMPSKVLHLIYNRLDVKDAKKLQARIRGQGDVSPELFRQARSNMLQIEGDKVGPARLFKIVGLSVFADAMDDDSADMFRRLLQKMDPKDAYLLKRFVDERRLRQPMVPREVRRSMIIDALGSLSREGRIDSSIGRFFGAEYEALPTDEPVPQTPESEISSDTASQLA